MNVNQLLAAIEESGQSRHFSINLVARRQSGLPNNVTVVEPSDELGHWVVYYTERGEIWDRHEFDSEEAACEYAHSILMRSPHPVTRGPLTDEERRIADNLARERIERKRARLISLGLDPVTGNSAPN
jgi:hypothetical protein